MAGVESLEKKDHKQEQAQQFKNTNELLVSLGVSRRCCVRMFRTHVDTDELEMDVAEAAARVERLFNE